MWKAKIIRIGDLVSGNAQMDVNFYKEEDEVVVSEFIKSFSLDFMSINNQEAILNIIRAHKDSLIALDNALSELTPLIDQEIE
jgi:hypothetical protein